MPTSCLLLTEFSFFGFHKEFLLSIITGFILMNFFTCLKNLIQHHYLSLRRNLGKYKKDFCSEKIIDGNCVRLEDLAEESTGKSNNYPDSQTKISRECMDESDIGDEDESRREEDDECDDSSLRRLVKIERSRGNAAVAELVKERASSATAAEEAMAMILRLQNEKSSIEMESNQYRRLAEEKQIHDHQVIQSLQWLVWRNEMEVNLLQQQLNRLLKSGESAFRLEDDQSENVFCSSLDFNL